MLCCRTCGDGREEKRCDIDELKNVVIFGIDTCGKIDVNVDKTSDRYEWCLFLNIFIRRIDISVCGGKVVYKIYWRFEEK